MIAMFEITERWKRTGDGGFLHWLSTSVEIDWIGLFFLFRKAISEDRNFLVMFVVKLILYIAPRRNSPNELDARE